MFWLSYKKYGADRNNASLDSNWTQIGVLTIRD